MNNNEKGITLIALIITVIILLILAGVAISIAINGENLFGKASQARESWNTAVAEEQTKINEVMNLFDLMNGEVSKLTTAELDALEENGIAEIAKEDITNSNLIDNSRIKAVITGNVPITTEMTYITGTVDTGVVVSINGNEFVWVPVPNVVWDGTTPIASHVYLAEAPNSYTPMAQVNNSFGYTGIYYRYSGSTYLYENSFYSRSSTNSQGEPVLALPLEETDGYVQHVLNYIESEIPSEESLQDIFRTTVESIIKYGGFFVSRYEMGLENSLPVSKPANEEEIISADAYNEETKTWYGLYWKAKSMYPEENNGNVVSSMIWSSQYDAMMNWMAKNGNEVGNADYNNKQNRTFSTGGQPDDIINNVYDLYGCHYEWTLGAQR